MPRRALGAAATGAITAQKRYRQFDAATTAELRSYAPIFTGQVRVAGTLASTR